jgi:hypothetical protein
MVSMSNNLNSFFDTMNVFEISIFIYGEDNPFWNFPSTSGNRQFMISLDSSATPSSYVENLPILFPLINAKIQNPCLSYYLSAASATNLLTV